MYLQMKSIRQETSGTVTREAHLANTIGKKKKREKKTKKKIISQASISGKKSTKKPKNNIHSAALPNIVADGYADGSLATPRGTTNGDQAIFKQTADAVVPALPRTRFGVACEANRGKTHTIHNEAIPDQFTYISMLRPKNDLRLTGMDGGRSWSMVESMWRGISHFDTLSIPLNKRTL